MKGKTLLITLITVILGYVSPKNDKETSINIFQTIKAWSGE